MLEDKLAYCGIVCSVCKKYLQVKMPCLGCKCDDSRKSNYCKTCGIFHCEKRIKNVFDYCDKCDDYSTCEFILEKETRYKTYSIPYNPKENLEEYRKLGYSTFINDFEKKYSCECGGKYSVQKGICTQCGRTYKETK